MTTTNGTLKTWHILSLIAAAFVATISSNIFLDQMHKAEVDRSLNIMIVDRQKDIAYLKELQLKDMQILRIELSQIREQTKLISQTVDNILKNHK